MVILITLHNISETRALSHKYFFFLYKLQDNDNTDTTLILEYYYYEEDVILYSLTTYRLPLGCNTHAEKTLPLSLYSHNREREAAYHTEKKNVLSPS